MKNQQQQQKQNKSGGFQKKKEPQKADIPSQTKINTAPKIRISLNKSNKKQRSFPLPNLK